jgi:uncharacterized damage-inducible protein DinB
MAGQPEVWLRGPVAGVPAPLQPVAHALLWALEDIERLAPPLTMDELWARPGGAASVGFHLRHMIGALDRLFTYARAEPLSDVQKAALLREKDESLGDGAAQLLTAARAGIAAALDQLRRTDPATLDDAREVGRARLPSTVRGLLAHGAEHAVRHAGQIATTAKIVRAPA